MNQAEEAQVRQRILYIIDEASGGMSRAEVARRIGMDPSNLSKHLTGKLAVSRSLINRIVVDMGVSRRWLLSGEGVPFEKAESPAHIDHSDIRVTPKGMPVYDIDVTAGNRPLERILTADNISGYVDLPGFNADCVLVRVNGDSMEPGIIDGGYIAIRPIRSKSLIFWGRIYVVVMEEYRMVKYMRRHPVDNDLVILHSSNPNYDDIEVPRSDIQSLFLVEGILNYRNLSL